MKLLSILILRGITLAVLIAINFAVAVWRDSPQLWLVAANITSVIVTGIFTYVDVRRAEREQR